MQTNKRAKLSVKAGSEPTRTNIGIVAGELAQDAFGKGVRYDAANARFQAGLQRAAAERVFGKFDAAQAKLFDESYSHQLRQLSEQTGFGFAKERSPLKLFGNPSSNESPALRAAHDINHFAQYMGGYDVDIKPSHEIPHRERYTVQVWQRGRPRNHATLMGQFWVYDNHVLGWRSAADPGLGQYVKELSAKLGEVQTAPAPRPPVLRPPAPEPSQTESDRMMREDERAMRRYATGIRREERQAVKKHKRNDAYSPFAEQLPGGRAAGMQTEDFEPAELERGAKHELEHTQVPGQPATPEQWQLAQEIAMDHLAEDGTYYQMLAQIEQTPNRRSRHREGDELVMGMTVKFTGPWLLAGTPVEVLEVKMQRGQEPRLLVKALNRAEQSYRLEYWVDESAIESYGAMQPNATGYYVWPLTRDHKPMVGEGPWGPYPELTGAKTFARIGAALGKHDRAVTVGREPSSPSFKIVRVYAAKTGERRV